MGKNNRKNSLLWRIAIKGGPPSFVFGTIHVKADFAFENLEPVLQALDSCQAFAAELSLEDAARHPSLAAAVFATPDNHLPTVLSEKKYEKIRALLKRATNMDINQLVRLRPMLMMNILDEAFMPKAGQSEALDAFLWNQAKAKEKNIYGLETVESQAQLMQDMDPKEELAAFLHQVKNISKSRRQIKKTINWYREGNIWQLYQSTYRSLGKWRYVLLKKRNHTMANRIVEISAERTVFAAVGAAHLAGKEGVLALLKREGYSVSPVF
ncbi:MAG TPA: TraB/GumN family protein [Saprospiraceae bacterium]|nr:TraB/GumN family protein [Saprospiraceae bacterium]